MTIAESVAWFPWKELGVALAILVVTLLLRLILSGLYRRQFLKPDREQSDPFGFKVHLLMERAIAITVLLAGGALAVDLMALPGGWSALVDRAMLLVFIVLGAWLGTQVSDLLLIRWEQSASRGHRFTDTVELLRQTIKVLIAIVTLLIILQDVFGYSVSGLVAGLGLGGLAVALAAQKGLADILGSITLVLDKPFSVGDWVRSPDGQLEGFIQQIGFRSTRLRTFEQTTLVVPNSRMVEFLVDNVEARPKRRIDTKLYVHLDTPPAKLRVVSERLEAMLMEHPEIVNDDFLLVRLNDITREGYEFTFYCFSAQRIWQDYMRVRQDVLLRSLELLEQEQVALAKPVRDVYLSDSFHSNRL